MGGPIAMLIENRDFATGNGPDGRPWTHTMNKEPVTGEVTPIHRLRPGHADTPGISKYKQSDARNILERSSARESTARVAVGALARNFLSEFSIEVHSHVTNIGGVQSCIAGPIDWNLVEDSPARCADPDASQKMIKAIDDAREAGDSLGGIVEIIATGLPIGLGSHIQWDRKLSTRLAAAAMSMNAVKGVEFGVGFAQAEIPGSKVHDIVKPVNEWELNPDGSWVKPWPRRSNNSGGLEGGMTTGEPLVVRAMVKPIATLKNPLPTVDLTTGALEQAHYERSDVTFVHTCAIIGEAMVAIVLAEAMLEKFGGDHIDETLLNFTNYLSTIGPSNI